MIKELLKSDSIIMELKGNSKEAVLREFIEYGSGLGLISNNDEFFNKILELENLGSSALEKGIAIPHLRDNFVSEMFLLLGISHGGVDFDSIDSQPSKLIFFIGAKKNDKMYLPLLSRISRMCSYGEIRDDLLSADSPDDILGIISEWEV
ncbi:PTS sugar transporter subunit IIA [bacterium]|nr:PTS sugar transporter subunit IIA [bacterium]